MAPATLANGSRSRSITLSARSRRSSIGFSEANTVPVLVPPGPTPPPPVKPTAVSTAGSDFTMSMNWVSFCCISWNEVLWSAWIEPTSNPVSCCGTKPLGTTL
ncbi:hypothetical protein ABIF13_006466 [Bradyrhizobium elkanii]